MTIGGEPYKPGESSKKSSVEREWFATKPRHKLKDVILPQNVMDRILDVLSIYKFQDKLMNEWGLAEHYQDRNTFSVNLYGPPGTGKTMVAHAIANELGKEMICVDVAEIESKYVGETGKNINSLFETAANRGAIILFDEADALLSRRITDMHSSADVSVNQTRSVLLSLLNDYPGVVLFTTNFIQNLDPAFLRRIQFHIKFSLPEEDLRYWLWRMYIPEKLPTDADLHQLATKFSGVSGSDIATAVFSAALKAVRNGAEMVTQKEFEDAIESIDQVKSDNLLSYMQSHG